MNREFIGRKDKEDLNNEYDFPKEKERMQDIGNRMSGAESPEPISTGYSQEEFCTDAENEIFQRIQKIKNGSDYEEYKNVSKADGSFETLEFTDTPEDDKPNEEISRRREQRKVKSCFNTDDSETREKKTKAIEKFYKEEEQTKKVTVMLRGIFNELFEKMNIDETAEDEIQNAAESFLTKRPWDVNKYPDYRKQLLYVMKYNVIPNMLNKYFGRKKKNMSDDEIQMRNFMGKGLRDAPRERNVFRKETIPDFDVDAENAKVIYNTEDKEMELRIDRCSYETEKESDEKEIRSRVMRKMIADAECAVLKKKDDEVDVLWEIIKNAEEYGKIDLLAAKKMNKTLKEVRTIKRRLTRYLRKERSSGLADGS